MKSLKTTTMVIAALLMLHSEINAQVSSAYIHEATPASITTSRTWLDTAVLDGNENLEFMVTHNYNPGGGPGIQVDKKLGLRYQSSKWYIFNQNLTTFVANTYYNVLIPGTDIDTWKHTSAAGNTFGNYTVIDDGRLNNNPNKKFHVFDNLLNYNTQVMGVFYSTSANKWCIYNQGGVSETMDENLQFNIIVPKANNSFEEQLHTADGNNTSNHFTYLNHPDLNNNPDAIIFITQVWNPGGTQTGVYNNHNVGVQYNDNNGKWRIYNEDLANMPLGASFNVMIFRNSSIGLDESKLAVNSVRIVPNPVTSGGTFTLVLDDALDGDVTLEIYDLTGKLMMHKQVTKTAAKQTETFFADNLKPGMYLLNVSNNGKQGTQKLIVQ